MTPQRAFCVSKMGIIEIQGQNGKISNLGFFSGKRVPKNNFSDKLLSKAANQLQDYLDGRRKNFSLKLEPMGSPFQKKVWKELSRIPYGKTTSYQSIARNIGAPRATRAVGTAIGRNPLMILIPCHRVIRRDGSLSGFAGGVHRKKWLLNHEKKD